MQLRIASINIERSTHLTRVEKFLRWYQPDVLCLQEVMAHDVPLFEEIIGNQLHYAHMCNHPHAGNQSVGIGIIAWGAMEDVIIHQYGTTADNSMKVEMAEKAIFASYKGFRIATTHVRVTKEGASTPEQRATVSNLITFAQSEASKDGLLITGDFNAPRGGKTFDLLAEAWIDGVPSHYSSSIDGNLHKAGPLPYMVDGLFHTPTYKLEDAQLHTGVSDHCALTCTLTRA